MLTVKLHLQARSTGTALAESAAAPEDPGMLTVNSTLQARSTGTTTPAEPAAAPGPACSPSAGPASGCSHARLVRHPRPRRAHRQLPRRKPEADGSSHRTELARAACPRSGRAAGRSTPPEQAPARYLSTLTSRPSAAAGSPTQQHLPRRPSEPRPEPGTSRRPPHSRGDSVPQPVAPPQPPVAPERCPPRPRRWE